MAAVGKHHHLPAGSTRPLFESAAQRVDFARFRAWIARAMDHQHGHGNFTQATVVEILLFRRGVLGDFAPGTGMPFDDARPVGAVILLQNRRRGGTERRRVCDEGLEKRA